ncbi:L-histidine N(alpha)-methyltransferase [Sphingomonas sp. ASY06-1R]|uniref:L-histidine N(alpha)-methyltransferase n=1 Tax=Sphingomonas sp. ASY06-1R TaxID=3445771 RepID=UPI003FA342C2
MPQAETMVQERDLRPPVEADPAFLADVIDGLSQRKKAIPARWFYDRRGSELFEEITVLPEYYPTRTESGLLAAHSLDVGRIAGPGRAVVEFGSGSSVKTPLLLTHVDASAYVPIDISGDFLREAAAGLSGRFPDLSVLPVEANFMQPVALPDEIADLPKLGFFPGSTIGNLVPRSGVNLLRDMIETMGIGAMLLIGMDRVKDTDILTRAYDDSAGVTAAFNLNLLQRINRELDGDIPLDAFKHRAIWNDTWSRIEMHLAATRDVSFMIAGRHFEMGADETIHTENSHKYTPRSARQLLAAGGWTPLREWSDDKDMFSLILAEARPEPTAP